jgi:hypothetical protein
MDEVKMKSTPWHVTFNKGLESVCVVCVHVFICLWLCAFACVLRVCDHV